MLEAQSLSHQRLFAGPGAVASQMQSYDWAGTGLGAVDTWPGVLKTSLSILLNGSAPMACIWGRDRTLFYNDAWAALWSDSGLPLPLGKPISDLETAIWEPLASSIEQVFANGEPVFLETDAYCWSYSPLWDATAQVAGVFATGCPVTQDPNLQEASVCSQTEAELEESQTFIRRVAETAPGLLYVYDLIEQRNVYINRQVSDLLGYGEAEIQGMGEDVLLELMHPDDLKRVDAHLARFQLADDSDILEIEYRMQRADGEWRWFQAREVVFTRSAAGVPQRMLGIGQDTTERKLTEQALQQAEERLRVALQSSPITVFNQDLDLKYTWMYHPTQFDLNDILGKRDRDFLPPADADYLTALKQQVIDTGVGLHQEVSVAIENRQQFYNLTLEPLRDTDNAIVGVTGSSINISDLKRIELELRENERSLSTLIGNLPGFVFRTLNDAEWTMLFVSKGVQEVTGYSADDFLQNTITWEHLVHAADRERVRAEAADHIETQTPIRITYRITDAQGNLRWVWERATPVFSETGDIAFWEGFISDVTARKQAEIGLKLSEERYRLLNSTLSAIVWSTDAEGAFVTPQPEWELYTGQPWAEHQGLGRLQAIHPDDRELVQQRWQQAKETLTTHTVEGRLWHAASQTYRYFEARGMAIFDSDGSVREWVGNIADVHDRKQAEAALRQSEDRLRMAVESARLGTWDWNLVDNELVWDVSCKAMFGLPPEADITIDTFFAALHPDDRALVEHTMQQVLEPDSGGSYNLDFRTVGIEDGIERWISAKGRAYFDQNGTPQRFIGTVLDISDIKQAEQALRTSEAIAMARVEELAVLMETTPAAIWIAHDPDCHEMTANRMAYELMGTEPGANATATPPDDNTSLLFKPFKDGEEIVSKDLPMQKAIRTRQEVADELEFVFPDGTIRTVYGRAVPLFGSDGTVRGAIAGFTEITNLKAIQREREELLQRERLAREEAEHANRLKDQFLAVLSHELRSPLNPILGWSSLLQTRSFDADRTAQALATIERNARLQAQLVDDLLDMAKILRGKLTLNQIPIKLAFVVEAAMEAVKTAAQAKAIAITLDLDPDLQVLGDAVRLQQIVWNLLSNAIKFTPNQGQVTVQLTQINGQACIIVSDNGTGISSEFLPYLFESFRQEDISITRRHGGLGLGLAIVQQLVEAHGGTIAADSPGEGQGATFTVYLPELIGKSTPTATAISPSTIDLTGVRVLVVDDSADTLDFLAVLLTQYNAEVIKADSGTTALDAFKTVVPHVLVSDIGMPEMDGYSLIRQIRALPADQGGQIPAIALTAYARPDDQQKALDSGYQKHLTKPLDVEKLAQTIQSLI